ncbi:MAG: hypothetical protein MK085_03905 [Phycisphaerales bacterium]|nr:hypothetical protein [Phycisphaerales bacterium]
MNDLQPELLAWSALLGRWIDLVKAGHGMPAIGEGSGWQASIPSIIELQATTFALEALETIDEADRPLARDRGLLLIENASEMLSEAWQDVGELPGELLSIVDAAEAAVDASFYAGLRCLWWNGPGTWEVPGMQHPGSEGTLAMMQPGTIVLPGEPVAWFTERPAPSWAGSLEVRPGTPVQVQRLIEDGQVRHDLLTDLSHELVGVPLLVPICLGGHGIGEFTVEVAAWRAAQLEVLGGGELPPVLDVRGGGELNAPTPAAPDHDP